MTAIEEHILLQAEALLEQRRISISAVNVVINGIFKIRDASAITRARIIEGTSALLRTYEDLPQRPLPPAWEKTSWNAPSEDPTS